MSEVVLDFETRSDIDLRTCGADAYFASPHFRALMAAYSIDHGPIQTWLWPAPCPTDLRAHIEAGGTIRAFNAGFERGCLEQLAAREGWPDVAIEQFQCSAATAAALSLPRSLDRCGAALGLDVQKDKAGAALIRKFCIPRKARKDEAPDGLYWNEPEDHSEDFARFLAYCVRDVEAEIAADRRMMPLRSECQYAYTLNERINSRGIRIDIESAHAALALAEKAKAQLDTEMKVLTGYNVTECSQVAALKRWIEYEGVDISSLAKAEIEEILEREDLPDRVRRAVEIRQEYAKTSVSKLTAMLKRAGPGGRVRGSFLFRAAGTGRYSSTGVQWQNLPRPRKEFGDAHLDQANLFRAIRTGDPDWLRLQYGESLGRPLWLVSDAIRGFLWAAPAHDLLVADYSGIEGAVAAWFAGEQWKVAAMFDLMADPSLPDLYRRAAAGIFNCPVDLLGKKDVRRQVGKVSELSLQYQGGVGAFRSMARNYSLKIAPVFAPVWEAADAERREKAVSRYEECCERNELLTQQLSREEWLAAELVKIGWRATHPAIVQSWKLLEAGVREAVDFPGRVVTVLKCSYVVSRGFLWCKLPSGRCLAYGKPQVRQQVVPWADPSVAEEAKEKRPVVTVLGVDSVTKQWVRYGLYGGILFENIVQAIALDLLDNGIALAEEAGYPVIGHVHDEIITEVPRGWGDVEEFERLICRLPAWAEGLPLTAGGWRGKRYRKD